MKTIGLVLLLCSSLYSSIASAQAGGLDEELFNRLLDQSERFYQPIVSRHDAKLVVVRKWTRSKNAAYASRQDDQWEIHVSGGLARRPLLTPDAFTLILCHEFGHHLGGYPFTVPHEFGGSEWMSEEGQADYYASFVCAKALWKDQLAENQKAEATVDTYAKRMCDRAWLSPQDRQLCYRTANAGQSMMNDLSDELGEPLASYERPETRAEFSVQCRLDTILQGALCGAEFDLNSIPGHLDPGGPGSETARLEAERRSCAGDQLGTRPACWYRR
jgi:hypothetical protein